MKKLSLFMLMAVGLLISGNAWAALSGTGAKDNPYVVENAEDFGTAFANTSSAASKTYIKLGGNIDTPEATYTAEGNRYIDLNGYTLKAKLTVTGTNKYLYLQKFDEESTSSGVGTFNGTVSCTTLYIESGAQIKGAITGGGESKPKVSIRYANASFEGTFSNFASLTIGTKGYNPAPTIKSTGTPFFEGTTTINAGTFNFDPEDENYLPGDCTIPDGYVSVDNGDGTWTVKQKNVMLNGVVYDDFASAYNVVQPNETIEVYTAQKISSDIDKAITIQGNGQVITLDQSVTIEDVTFDGVSSISLYGSAPSNIDVKMKNCSVTSSSSTIYIQSNVHSLTLLNCSISSSSSNVIKTGSQAVPQVDIDGCALVANGYTAGIDCGKITVLNVNNTTISSIESAISCSSTCTCNLKGNTELTTSSSEVDVIEGLGTYNINPYTVKFNKDISSELKTKFGFTTQQEGDWYVVTSATAPVVLVKGDESEVNYYSLETAIAAATEDDIVKLNADQSIPVTIPAGKKVIIDLNGNKITCLSYKSGTKMLSVLGDLTITNSNATQAQWGEPLENLTDAYCLTPAINVANGGKLTINGDVVIYGNGRAIQAEAGSELYLDGATVSAKYNAAVYFEGAKSVIKNSIISSLSSTALTPNFFSYAINVSSSMTIEGTTVTGVQGAVGVMKEGTRLTVRDCDLQAHHTSGKNDCHAALYVCTYAVVDVWNTNMKSDREHYAAFVGNNDTSNEWGIINLYGGCLLSDKMYVQLKKDATSSFPAYIPKNSDWYKLWKETTTEYTGDGPLPTGYSYQSISESGYSWKVVAPAETDESKTKDEPAETEVWGLTSSWSSDKVPVANTIVTISHDIDIRGIGEGATSEAVAEQIFINPDATLTVESGVQLNVGDGGMNIAEGGQMIIEPGAVVKVGAAGVINSSDDAIVIKAEEGKAGTFLIGPAVTEATHPYATVEMYTRAREISTTEHRWQHFAIPTIGVPDTTPLPHDKKGVADIIYIYEWNYQNQEWQPLGTWDKLNIPFKGYDLTNNLPETTYQTQGGVTYTFHGNIIGNGDGDLQFLSKGYNFFGNSYTAPIDIKTMFESLDANIEKTIAIYDVEKDQYVYSNEMMIDLGFATNTQISPLQGFFLNLKSGSSLNDEINYKDAVYNNPHLQAGQGGIFAPAQKAEINANTVAIHIKANGNADCITLVAMEDLTNDFEDGFDATKLMNNSNLNIYANTMVGKLGIVATNELEGITMDFQSNDATQYTMTFANVNGQVYDLLDVMTGARTRMEEGASYTFNADANSLVANRFQVCAAAYAPTQMESVKAKAAQGIHTVLGQPVGNNWNALPAGVYIINGVRVVK